MGNALGDLRRNFGFNFLFVTTRFFTTTIFVYLPIIVWGIHAADIKQTHCLFVT